MQCCPQKWELAGPATIAPQQAELVATYVGPSMQSTGDAVSCFKCLDRVVCLLRCPLSCRCHTWTGRLHEDAFEDDLFDQLLNLHMRPQLLNTALPGAQTTTDGVWQHLQQQQHPQPYSGAGAAAAAVEAAVAAINQLLSGVISSPPAPSLGLSKYPPGSSSPVAGGDCSGSSSPTGPGKSSPSFYKALMATGGVLRPPGGPPIPLNVDFAAEIQPNLGRLLGRGGFGHVYEATWRGQRVSGIVATC